MGFFQMTVVNCFQKFVSLGSKTAQYGHRAENQ